MRRELTYCAVALMSGFGLGVAGNIVGWGYETTKLPLVVGIVVGLLAIALFDPTIGRRARS